MVYNRIFNMTYLLITKQKNLEIENLKPYISKLWKRDIVDSDLKSNPDVKVLDGRVVNSIGIEDVKALQEEMRYKPFKELVQIAVIFDAKKLTVQAQNSFLKTLEESPDSTAYFLLASSERDLLATIVSRSKKIYLKDISNEQEGVGEVSQYCFEDTNLITAFKVIEGLAKEKLECIEYLEGYLSALQKFFRWSINEGTNIRKVTEKIYLVNTTKGQIMANGNRRLLLENLYLQIQDLG